MTGTLMIAAPHSGAGKTTLTLALLRAFRARGIDMRAAKSGPDYIDPQFHAAACGVASVNLDAWAMGHGAIRSLASRQGGEMLLVEAAMGLLDGAPDGTGSAADLAGILGAPVIMVIDASKQAHSAALPLAGARTLRPDLNIAGAILNRVGSDRHARIARQAVEDAGFTVLGCIPRDAAMATPSRHLGLVQAAERPDLEGFIEGAARLVAAHVDLDALAAIAAPLNSGAGGASLPPLGQQIAIARDDAFAFAYPHLLAGWRAQGAALSFFSPLADEGPAGDADAVFLPGGYPELHAGQIANAHRFGSEMRKRQHDSVIYGECGGYMTLGEGLVDAAGTRHRMLGLLPLTTSFARRKLHLGYRRLMPLGGPFTGALNGHEFHYATIVEEGGAPHLFDATDAEGTALGGMGMVRGRISGSFAHVIAPG